MLRGYKVYLRLLEQKDIGMLLEISNEENVRKYNIKYDNTESSNDKINLRKALGIINENDILIGFITYKKNNCYKDVYSIGITIGSRYWDRGYGEDSIKTLLKYLFSELNAEKIELEVMRNNLRAINCYKKCGFKEYEIKQNDICIEDKQVETLIMGILREDEIYI